MLNITPPSVASLLLICVSSAGLHAATSVSASQYRIPLIFEENRGQVSSQFKFLARAKGYTLVISGDQILFRLASASPTEVRLTLIGANPTSRVTGIEPQSSPPATFWALIMQSGLVMRLILRA